MQQLFIVPAEVEGNGDIPERRRRPVHERIGLGMQLHTGGTAFTHDPRMGADIYQQGDSAQPGQDDRDLPIGMPRSCKKRRELFDHQFGVEPDQQRRTGPGQEFDDGPDGKIAHRFLIADKMDQGNDGKTQLYAKDDWLNTSRASTSDSPKSRITITAGMIASSRVISRRTQGLIRSWR